ncbi:hypothetical protein Hneap_1583 [Halothiobacillus neapolitanus c2]|uniref:Uncharacterized protein n=2 Tax=Halothiobacillus neapolitanus TaxID=927 RepID=D0L140_HALNC|nr:hypothetical protein Hneap_1583 [Halothiobacillus neapolitanus c2]
MHGLAAAAVGLCGVAAHLPLLVSLDLVLASGLLLYRLANRKPSAFFDTGHLVLSGQSARWLDGTGRLLEGDVTWLWTGPRLVGLVLKHREGYFPIWITCRRVGDTAWWQMQRWLRFEQVRSGSA